MGPTTGSVARHDGDRPDLVLVHGLGSAATFWDNLVPHLAGSFRVHAVDLPGHGPEARQLSAAEATPARLAEEVVDRLKGRGVDRPHLVGLSLGGWVVLEAAALGYGASVLALAPAGLWVPGARIERERLASASRHLLVPLDPLLPWLATRRTLTRLGLRLNVAHSEQVTAAQFLAAARAARQAKAYAACDRAAVEHRFEGGARIGVPVTVAFGDRDLVLPPHTSQDRSLVPTARWVVVPDSGHAISWDQPQACLDLIAATVARDGATS